MSASAGEPPGMLPPPAVEPLASVLLAEVTDELRRAGVPTPDADARALIDHHRFASGELDRAVARRVAREPLEYITGVAHFRTLALAVGPGVFIPRRESAVVVQLAMDALHGSRSATPIAVDLGAGSGAIALALAREVQQAEVFAVEVAPAAFDWTLRNVTALGSVRVHAVLADLADALPELDGTVDVVVCNPPYIPAGYLPRDPEVRLHSPAVALYGGPDGFDVVRGVSAAARRLLRIGGTLVLEHGELQAAGVAAVLRADGWSGIGGHPDHAGKDRATTARRPLGAHHPQPTRGWQPPRRTDTMETMTDPAATDFPPWFFDRDDPSPDPDFYRSPRLVTHIDDGAIAAVTDLYADLGVDGSAGTPTRVLDLMSSWVSHLRTAPAELTVLGLNANELAANPMATRRVVQDLNVDPVLSFADAEFDAVLCCVSVDYLTRPVQVLAEAARVLRPGGQVVLTFSNRCFPSKAVHGWLSTDDAGRCAIVVRYLQAVGGFDEPQVQLRTPEVDERGRRYRGDPLYAVVARRR